MTSKRDVNQPGYVASSFSSFRSLVRTSAGSSGASFLGGGAGFCSSSFARASASLPGCAGSPAPATGPPSPLAEPVSFTSPFCGAWSSEGGFGVVARLGSSSSMTKAASKTAGSRFAAPSSFLETSWLCFLALGFLAVDAALLLLETDDDCLGLPVLLPAPACSLAAFWRACSSAMTLSSEPLRR